MIRICFERLIDLLSMGQQPEVGAPFVQALPDAGKGVEHEAVDLT